MSVLPEKFVVPADFDWFYFNQRAQVPFSNQQASQAISFVQQRVSEEVEARGRFVFHWHVSAGHGPDSDALLVPQTTREREDEFLTELEHEIEEFIEAMPCDYGLDLSECPEFDERMVSYVMEQAFKAMVLNSDIGASAISSSPLAHFAETIGSFRQHREIGLVISDSALAKQLVDANGQQHLADLFQFPDRVTWFGEWKPQADLSFFRDPARPAAPELVEVDWTFDWFNPEHRKMLPGVDTVVTQYVHELREQVAEFVEANGPFQLTVQSATNTHFSGDHAFFPIPVEGIWSEFVGKALARVRWFVQGVSRYNISPPPYLNDEYLDPLGSTLSLYLFGAAVRAIVEKSEVGQQLKASGELWQFNGANLIVDKRTATLIKLKWGA